MAPSPTSPTIDEIPVSSGNCPKTDQRGATRPDMNESFCNIGAYESASPDPITLRYTGPMSIKKGKNVSLSAQLTARNGGPISGRILRMQIGRGRYSQSCVTHKTNTAGKGSCIVKHVMASKSTHPRQDLVRRRQARPQLRLRSRL